MLYLLQFFFIKIKEFTSRLKNPLFNGEYHFKRDCIDKTLIITQDQLMFPCHISRFFRDLHADRHLHRRIQKHWGEKYWIDVTHFDFLATAQLYPWLCNNITIKIYLALEEWTIFSKWFYILHPWLSLFIFNRCSSCNCICLEYSFSWDRWIPALQAVQFAGYVLICW